MAAFPGWWEFLAVTGFPSVTATPSADETLKYATVELARLLRDDCFLLRRLRWLPNKLPTTQKPSSHANAATFEHRLKTLLYISARSAVFLCIYCFIIIILFFHSVISYIRLLDGFAKSDSNSVVTLHWVRSSSAKQKVLD